MNINQMDRFNYGILSVIARTNPKVGKGLRAQILERIGRRDIESIPTVPLATPSNDAQRLLSKIEPGKKYLLVIDLDGTVFIQHDNLLIEDMHLLNPDFPFHTFRHLDGISQQSKIVIKPVILTARASTDVQSGFGSRLLGLDKYTCFGFSHATNLRKTKYPEGITFNHKSSEPNFQNAINDWMQEVRRILKFLDELDLQNIPFTGDPNAFYIRLNDENKMYKNRIIDFVIKGNNDVFRWKPQQSKDGYVLIFANEYLPFDKADGLDFIFKHQGIKTDDQDQIVIIFGDSGTDLKAMRRAKELLPKDQVLNVRVGGAISDPDIDFSFNGPRDMVGFVEALHYKVSRNNPSLIS